MQATLCANGQIAEELAKELHRNFTQDIRLISRYFRKIHDTDHLVAANLLDSQTTQDVVKG